MAELYLGLMSGTSLDGVDAALVELDGTASRVHEALTTPYPGKLRERISDLLREPSVSLRALGELDVAIGRFFAECALKLLQGSEFGTRDIVAIGHSGHTVFHKPEEPNAFTMQLGDPSTVAAATGITTVGNLRNMDVALGGQGAPLAAAFHRWCFSDPSESRVAVNIGGIANVSVLQPNHPVLGFDTGPGNTLLDGWIRRCRGEPFDRNGEWSATGQVNDALLLALKRDAYFSRPPPKSTGLEHFNPAWLDTALRQVGGPLAEEDVQATLAELTAATIAEAIASTESNPVRIILCGGGALNRGLTDRISRLMPEARIVSSAEHGIGPEWVEAVLFAWLARARLLAAAGNAPSVTGARRPAPLGGVYSSTCRP